MDRGVGYETPIASCSSGADGVRTQHPVQDMNGDADLCRPTLIRACAQRVTDDPLVAPDGSFHAAAFRRGDLNRFMIRFRRRVDRSPVSRHFQDILDGP
jgi:hypothetical protein